MNEKLLKIANQIINSDIDMFEELNDNKLSIPERQKALQYFMATEDGIYDLLTICNLSLSQREKVLNEAINNPIFNKSLLVKIINHNYYENNNQKKLIINAIMNDKNYMKLILDLINYENSNLNYYDKLELLYYLIKKSNNKEQIKQKLNDISNQDMLLDMLLDIIL